jgi:hypothetical protein
VEGGVWLPDRVAAESSAKELDRLLAFPSKLTSEATDIRSAFEQAPAHVVDERAVETDQGARYL